VVVVPIPLVPMAPTLVRPPFHRDGWVYEEKVDGWRMLAYKAGARVRLISRNAVDHTARFRELAAAIAKLRADVLLLDGEVAVFDSMFVSRFELLRDRTPAVLCTPPLFIAFDVLQSAVETCDIYRSRGDAGCLRTRSQAPISSCPCDGSSPTVRTPGRPSSDAALRASSRRTRRRPMSVAGRGNG
jgi:hypothetical protein